MGMVFLFGAIKQWGGFRFFPEEDFEWATVEAETSEGPLVEDETGEGPSSGATLVLIKWKG